MDRTSRLLVFYLLNSSHYIDFRSIETKIACPSTNRRCKVLCKRWKRSNHVPYVNIKDTHHKAALLKTCNLASTQMHWPKSDVWESGPEWQYILVCRPFNLFAGLSFGLPKQSTIKSKFDHYMKENTNQGLPPLNWRLLVFHVACTELILSPQGDYLWCTHSQLSGEKCQHFVVHHKTSPDVSHSQTISHQKVDLDSAWKVCIQSPLTPPPPPPLDMGNLGFRQICTQHQVRIPPTPGFW